MFGRFVIIGLIFIALAALVSGCAQRQESRPEEEVAGKVLIWHSWNDAEEATLTQILERFTAINQKATVKIQGFDSVDEMLSEFEIAADSGLGPDVLIAPSDAAKTLAEADLIRDIDDYLIDGETERYLRGAVQSMEVDGRLYGFPASLNTTVLYYNKDLVETPPTTLAGLMEEATAGNVVAMPDNFRDTFWGIQAFGGEFFDEEGRLILDRGGFANWLAWLKTARDLPGLLLDPDATTLQERFLDGDAAYYIGSSQDLQSFDGQMGENVLGVAPLPSGPIGLAGPLLGVDGLLFSSASSNQQTALAVELARFLTNPEQSALLMREVQHVPANLGLNINPSLMPTMSSLSVQARNSIALADMGEVNAALETVAESYDRVIEGLLDPAQAATDVTTAVNQELGFEDTGRSESTCESIGVLRIANLLPPDQAAVIAERLDDYADECPNVILRNFSMGPDELEAMLSGTSDEYGYADLIIGPQTALPGLVDGEHIRKIADLLTADELQRFQPKALDAMRYEDGLFGFPLYSDVNALYYNREMIPDPALNLVDIETEAAGGLPIALEANAANGFWGFGSMGGLIGLDDPLTEQNADALAAWLTWLNDMRETGAIELVDEHFLARQMFLDGETAYYVGAASEYPSLQALEDAELLDVSLLPSGAGGEASPILSTYGIMLNSASTDGQADLAANLIRFLTDQVSGDRIAETGSAVPANATVDLNEHPILAVFAQQTLAAAVLPNTPELAQLVASLDGLFATVLEDNTDPEEAVAELFHRIDESNMNDQSSADEEAPDQSQD